MDRRAKLIEIVRIIGKKDAEPAPDESLFDSGLLDSNDLPDVVSAIEETFGLSIPDSDLNPVKFDSIERIEAYLESRK